MSNPGLVNHCFCLAAVTFFTVSTSSTTSAQVAAHFSGRVTDALGNPVALAYVEFHSLDQFLRRALTDADGQFDARLNAPIQWPITVHVRRIGYRPETRRLWEADLGARVDLVMSPFPQLLDPIEVSSCHMWSQDSTSASGRSSVVSVGLEQAISTLRMAGAFLSQFDFDFDQEFSARHLTGAGRVRAEEPRISLNARHDAAAVESLLARAAPARLLPDSAVPTRFRISGPVYGEYELMSWRFPSDYCIVLDSSGQAVTLSFSPLPGTEATIRGVLWLSEDGKRLDSLAYAVAFPVEEQRRARLERLEYTVLFQAVQVEDASLPLPMERRMTVESRSGRSEFRWSYYNLRGFRRVSN